MKFKEIEATHNINILYALLVGSKLYFNSIEELKEIEDNIIYLLKNNK